MSVTTDEDFTDIILSGKLTDVPPLPNRALKIYLCSNKSDFELERYHLWRDVLPALQHHCMQYGLDVVWTDVHYGSDTDHVLDAYRFQRHLEEIKQCHQSSVGPFFICLIGNKYGDYPLPTYIDEQEFVHIKNGALRSGKDVTLLDDWYCKDHNSIPIVYRLRPIREQFPDYDYKTKMQLKDHLSDIDSWTKVYTNLMDIIQTGSKEKQLERHTNFNDNKQNGLYNSGLEKEIKEALALSPNGCIVIERNIESINTGVVGATAFVDLETNIAIDISKQLKLKQLKEKIKNEVTKENVFSFDISWLECDNIHKVIEQHGEYMDNLLAATASRLLKLTQNGLALKPKVSEKNESLCFEALVHLKHCKDLMVDYSVSGFEHIILSVQDLMITGRSTDHHPILMTGQPGCGMSTFISKLCHHCSDILGKNTTLIVRYIGLTKPSTDGVKLLRDICMQINHVLQQDINLATYDIGHLKSYFHGLINRISKTDRNLIIALDGIDKLNGIGDVNESCDFEWLSSKLPSKVHMIISYKNSESLKIIKKLEKKYVGTNNVVTFPEWSLLQYSIVLNRQLSKQHRTLTKEQEAAILKMLQRGSPDLISTGIEIARDWTTNFIPSEHSLPSNLTEAVHQKLDSLELIFGMEVIRDVVSYVSGSEYGLSEMELLDVLSSNRELLKSLNLDNRPICRFPPFLWISLKDKIGPMLAMSDVHGKQLLMWRHSTIRDILCRRYIFLPEMKKQCHLDIVQLFLDITINAETMTESKQSVIDSANCIKCPQPLLYSNVKYNMRKINEVWIQLLNAGALSLLKEYALCNFEYLLAFIHSTSIDVVLNVLQFTLSRMLDAEIGIVYKSLCASRSVLLKHPLQLANELISRLRESKDLYSNHLESLVIQSMAWCDSYNFPLLLPLTSWMQLPRIPLLASVERLDGARRLTVLHNNQDLLCTSGILNIAMYNIPSNKMIKTFSGHRGSINCVIISHSGSFIVTGSDDYTSRIWKVMEGLCLNIIKGHRGAVTSMVLTPNDDLLITGSTDTNVLIFKVSTGKRLHTLEGHDQTVTCVKLNNAANMLLSGSRDRTIIIWCMEAMVKLSLFRDYINSPILSIDLSLDGTFLIVSCEDSTLNVISFATGSWIHQLKGHSGWINRIIICNNSNHVVAACQDGSVYVYNLRTTELLETFNGNNQPITDMYLSADETLLYASSESTVNVWNLHKKVTSNTANKHHDTPVTCVHVSDTIAATGSDNGMVKVWNLELRELKDSFLNHTQSITCIQVSYDCSFVVSGSRDKTLCVFDIALAVVITCYEEHPGNIQSLTIFSDDSQVLSIDCYSNLFIWKPHSGHTLRSFNFPASLYVLSSSGSHLVLTRGDQSIKVWSLEEDAVVTQVNHAEKITCIACSNDEQYIVTGSSDRSLKVWEMHTGKLTQVLVGHETEVICVSITEDAEHIVSGAKNGNLIIWKVQTGDIQHKLIGHSSKITAIKLTNKGQLIVTGSLDSTVRVWSLQYGEEITLIHLHCPVVGLSMSEDAVHMMVQLEKSKHAPILCLHNSPAAENNRAWSPEKTKYLPINLKPMIPLMSLEYPVPKPPPRKRNESISSIPEIVKLSPIRAPPSKKKSRRKPGKSTHFKSIIRGNSSKPSHKLSSVCSIL